MKRRVSMFLGSLLIAGVLAVMVTDCTPEKQTTPTTQASSKFEIDTLIITPLNTALGEAVTIEANASNTGSAAGQYTVILKIDDKEAGSHSLNLQPGEKEVLSFQYTPDKLGTLKVDLNGLSGTLTVSKPAQLTVTSMERNPETIFPGQEMTISAKVINSGEVRGTLPATWTVRGVPVDSQLLTLAPGEVGEVSYNLIRDDSGTYTVGILDMTMDIYIPDVENYASARYGYSMSYPANLNYALDDTNPRQVTVSGVDDILIVAIDIVDAGMSQSEYVNLLTDSNVKSINDFKVDSQSEITRDGSSFGFQQDFSFTTSRGVAIKGRQLLIKRGIFGFEVIYETAATHWDLRNHNVEALLASFKPPVAAVGAYSDTVHGYSLTLPSGWSGIEQGNASVPLRFQSSPMQQSAVNGLIGITPLSKTTTAKEFAADSLSSQPGLQVVSQGPISVGSATAYEYIANMTQGGTIIKLRDVIVTGGTQAFEIVILGDPAGFTANKVDIDKLVASFALIEARPFGVSRQDSMFRYHGDIVTLDPALTEEGADGLVGAIFSGLVKTGPDLKEIGDIAEKWEISADGKTYTFHIRDGVKFHNGKAVTAADVKYSWERACNPATKSRKASTYLGDIVGAQDMLAGKATAISGIRVVDDRTLEVTIDGHKPYFLGKISQPVAYVVDQGNVARGMNWTNAPNGTGPFKLKQWKKDDLLVLERNDTFYQPPVQVNNVVYRLFAGYPMMMYERGDIDITGVGLTDLDRVLDKSNPLNSELITGNAFDTGYIGFNVTKAPFDDPNVRQAFALALDLNKILEVSLKGIAERAAGYVPPGVPGNNPDLKPLPYDPVQAKELLSKSKYGSADQLPPVTLYVVYGANPEEEAMVAMWKQNLGVDVKVEVIKELKEYFERKHNRDFQLFVSSWRADYLDPQDFLEVLFQSNSEENSFAYSNATVDAALKEAAVETDTAKRIQKYQDIEKMILSDLPAIPFYQNERMYSLVKPYVKGLHIYPLGVNHWKDIQVVPH